MKILTSLQGFDKLNPWKVRKVRDRSEGRGAMQQQHTSHAWKLGGDEGRRDELDKKNFRKSR